MSSSAMRHSNESLNPRSGSGPGLRQRGNPLSRALGLLLLLGLLAAGLAGYLALPAPAAAQTPTPPANYDSDGDGLIEISSLAQLNAVRYDLNGNGAADSASNNDAYAAAFPVTDGGSVCPSGSTCNGYELTADLDFDENGDGEITTTDATYWDGGAGWQPIDGEFTGTFDGKGNTIANLFISRSSSNDQGLFDTIGSGGTVQNLGLTDVSVSGRQNVGGLAGKSYGNVSMVFVTGGVGNSVVDAGGIIGWNRGTISRSYAYAEVSGPTTVGGLAGSNHGAISASYAAGTVSGNANVGGLVGHADSNGSIKNSYAIAEVLLTGSNPNDYGGLVGDHRSGTISASYYDTSVQSVVGIRPVGSRSSAGVAGKTTSELTTPTGYTGIYATWDDDSDVWDFGTNVQYPALKTDFNGDSTATWQEFGYQVRKPYVLTATLSETGTEVALSWPDVTETAWPGSPRVSYALYRNGAAVAGYDGSSRSYTDTSMAAGQTHSYRVALLVDGVEAASGAASVFVPAPRADADGDGLIDIGSLAQLNAVRWDLDGDGLADDAANNPDYNAAFPAVSSGSSCVAGGEGEGACAGYELTADLDFDENSDGEITSADSAYWNNGAGWLPIGSDGARFTGVFDGGSHAVANLLINRPGTNFVGLFGAIDTGGAVRNLGLLRANISGRSDVGGLAGNNRGTIAQSYVTGNVLGTREEIGGLVGFNEPGGTVNTSYSTATVTGTGNQGLDGQAGGLVGDNDGLIISSYATGNISAHDYVGGLVGGCNHGSVSNSYATGNVAGNEQVGALVGCNPGIVSNSYAIGSLSGSRNGGIGDPGGTLARSYWNTDNAAAGDGEGKTTAELQAPTGYTGIYADWNLDLDGDSQPDAPWDFGTASQYPALKADFDGDGEATWQEFGYQVRQSLPLTATPSHDLKALLGWPDITEPEWTKTPTDSYALYRDGTEVTDYDGSSRFYTDAGLTNRQEYTYQVALLLDGAEVRRSKAVSMTAENRPHFGQAAIDNQVYMENTGIGTLSLPAATGGDGTLTYTLTPELPAGLSFDAAARSITGTPTEPQGATEYTYTATDDDGDEASLTFTIEVEETVAIARIDADSDGLIEIVSLAQLNAIRWDLDGDGMPAEGHETSYADAFPAAEGGSVCIAGTTCTGYELTANLDFDENGDGAITAADATYWHNGGGWEPIGLANGQFNGTLNGNGHTISNLYISRRLGRTYADGSPQNIAAQGLFGQLGADAVVRNLGLTQVNVSAEYIVGGLAGRNLGTIADSHVTGAVSGNNVVGGLTGDNRNAIKGSHAAVSVGGWKDVGGLAGENGHGGVISASYATGTVSGEKENAGGLVGYNGTLGVITESYATGTVEGERLIRGGGLAGHNQGTISVSYATGAVATGLGYSGGLVGENSGTIAASYATGLVSGQRDTGSLVGQNSGTVNASYSTGPVRSTIPGHRVGGLAGSNSGTITASYLDTQTAGISLATDAEAAINAGGTGMTTAELQSPTGYTGIYADWNSDLDGDGDGDSPWDFGSNGQYPALQADFNGDDTATWQEFGYQLRQRPTLAATATGTQAELTWDAPPAAHWTDAPGLAYALYRDGERVSGYDGSSLSYTDTGLTLGQTYTYQVAALLGGVETQHSNQVALVAGEGPDRAALTAFYHAAGGADWTNNGGWLSSRPLGEWYGVTTSADGRVVGLSLIDNNLSGTLPADLGKLERLEALTLDRNALTGAIPLELGNLRNLARLSMNRNQLTGAIPSELGSLSNLSIIGLARNSLSGSLPTSLGNLSGLTKLSLHDNTQLSGPLPSGFTSLANLQRLAVANSGICAPNSEAFSEWLDTVPDKPGGVQTCE